MKVLKSLQSATCDDCIWHTCTYNKIDWEGEDGYISRQDAIEAIRKSVSKSEAEDSLCYNLGLGVAEEVVSSLPSAEPKTGEWIECGTNTDGTHNIKCDQCGAGFRTRGHANSHNTKERFKWCPTCGARMLGEDGEA